METSKKTLYNFTKISFISISIVAIFMVYIAIMGIKLEYFSAFSISIITGLLAGYIDGMVSRLKYIKLPNIIIAGYRFVIIIAIIGFIISWGDKSNAHDMVPALIGFILYITTTILTVKYLDSKYEAMFNLEIECAYLKKIHKLLDYEILTEPQKKKVDTETAALDSAGLDDLHKLCIAIKSRKEGMFLYDSLY